MFAPRPPKADSKVSTFRVKSGELGIYHGAYTPQTRRAIGRLFYQKKLPCEKTIDGTELVIDLPATRLQTTKQQNAANQAPTPEIGNLKDLAADFRRSNQEWRERLEVFPAPGVDPPLMDRKRLGRSSLVIGAALAIGYAVRALLETTARIPGQLFDGLADAALVAGTIVWIQARSIAADGRAEPLQKAWKQALEALPLALICATIPQTFEPLAPLMLVFAAWTEHVRSRILSKIAAHKILDEASQ